MNLHTLQSREVKLVSDFLFDLYTPKADAEFADHLVDICAYHLRDFATGVAYDETRRSDGSFRLYSNSLDELKAYYEPVTAHISDHPGWQYAMQGGAERVLSIHDFVSHRQFQKSSLYQEAFKHFGSDYQFAVAVNTETHVGGLTFHRDRPIQESIRPLLTILAPHIDRAYAMNLQAASRKEIGSEYLTKYGLSRRESEVFLWVIQGKRDSEIAIILGISPKTVSKHVEHILSKLDVESRGAAVASIIKATFIED